MYNVVQYKLRIIYVILSHINPILKLNIFIQKIWMTLSTYEEPVIYCYMKLKLGIKYMIGCTWVH